MSDERSADRSVEAALRTAGVREGIDPSSADFHRHRDAARMVWERGLRTRRRRRAVQRLALAAAVLLFGAGAWLVLRGTWSPSAPVATLARAAGEVEVWKAGWRPLREGDALAAPARVRVTGGAAALDAEGVSLRLAADSVVALPGVSEGPRRVVLERGRVYVDTGGDSRRLGVETALGLVRDVGTSYLVTLRPPGSADEGLLEVRVRSGRIELDADGETVGVGAGEGLRRTTARGIERFDVAVSGEGWRWVTAVSPPFSLDGARLGDYLAWLQRETGWSVRFEDDDAGDLAAVRLSGSTTAGLTPEQTLETILPSVGLVHELEGDVLLLRQP